MIPVRAATFNVWSADRQFRQRRAAAAETVGALDLDLLAVQELRGRDDEFVAAMRTAGYRLVLGEPHPDSDGDCVAIFSRYPITPRPTPAPHLAVSGAIQVDGLAVGFTAIHLPSIAITAAERSSVSLADRLDEYAGYEILAGDFNCSPRSSVGRFWAGEQSVEGREQRWNDPVERWCCERGGSAPATVDFLGNPRWRDEPTLETPARFDRVIVRDTWKRGLPAPSVHSARVFGTEPAGLPPVVASDHYGVAVDLRFIDAIDSRV